MTWASSDVDSVPLVTEPAQAPDGETGSVGMAWAAEVGMAAAAKAMASEVGEAWDEHIWNLR